MWNCNSDANSYSYGYANGNCHGDRISHTHADGDANIDTVRRKMFSDTAASSDSSASPVMLVVASLPATPKLREGGCEAQT